MPRLKELKIGSATLKNPIVLAPLAGFGDAAFRRICSECGAGLTVTEMVSVNGLNYGNEKTKELLRRSPSEKPCAVQLFGFRPDVFERVLGECEELSGFEIIDINMGCPMPKVTKQGAGSALLDDIERAERIVAACVKKAGNRAVTVKMRLGTDSSDGCVEFAKRMCGAGAAALTVHGRTAKQLYSGTADWSSIAAIKKNVSVPVIGNGDITDCGGAARALGEYGADGVAIGRGALGRPWIFGEIALGSKADERQTAEKHIDYLVEYFSERYALVAFRKHAVHYLKGRQGGKLARLAVNEATTAEEMKAALVQALN